MSVAILAPVAADITASFKAGGLHPAPSRLTSGAPDCGLDQNGDFDYAHATSGSHGIMGFNQ